MTDFFYIAQISKFILYCAVSFHLLLLFYYEIGAFSFRKIFRSSCMETDCFGPRPQYSDSAC